MEEFAAAAFADRFESDRYHFRFIVSLTTRSVLTERRARLPYYRQLRLWRQCP
jgi:hypothetical protein